MWLIVNTDTFKEQVSIDLLREKHADVIVDVYFPLSRREYTSMSGERKARFQPLLQGMFFIKVKDLSVLRMILSPFGYFTYRGIGYDNASRQYAERTFFTKAHLLCPDCKNRSIDDIIRYAIIPDDDMQRFIYYSERMADGIEGLTIVDKRYDDLVQENDTIRILNGPMEGWVGIVKQVKHKGRKDRHLLVRFGDNLCLNISNIRQWNMRIEHEATRGAKSEAVGVWRAIDQLIGYFQAQQPDTNAPALVRQLLRDYHMLPTICRNHQLTNISIEKKMARIETAHRNLVLQRIDPTMRSNFLVLARYFQVDRTTIDCGLLQLIPDSTLRPFLTPTSGIDIPEGARHTVFWHNGIVELVLRCNLRHYFRDGQYDANRYQPVFDEDYDYYAHIALLPTPDGKVKAITSWGAFYDHYASQSASERAVFFDDLAFRHYPHMLRLLTDDDIRFELSHGIGGFSIVLDTPYTPSDIQTMAAQVVERIMPSAEQNASSDEISFLGQASSSDVTTSTSFMSLVTSAAVEMWQGTRMLFWRQLLQRHVLLHKVPIIDQPIVIPPDAELEEAFSAHCSPLLALHSLINARISAIRAHLEAGRLIQAVLQFLSVSKTLSAHFAADGLYNYITPDFDPNNILTILYDDIALALQADSQHPSALVQRATDCIKKGVDELKAMDSWMYFKFPAWVGK